MTRWARRPLGSLEVTGSHSFTINSSILPRAGGFFCVEVFVSALHLWPHVVLPTVYCSRSATFPSRAWTTRPPETGAAAIWLAGELFHLFLYHCEENCEQPETEPTSQSETSNLNKGSVVISNKTFPWWDLEDIKKGDDDRTMPKRWNNQFALKTNSSLRRRTQNARCENEHRN